MGKVIGQREVKANADWEVIETTQELIALFKREFGENWRDVFQATVSVYLASS